MRESRAPGSNVRELGSKGGETEKVSINIGFVDLGEIDLLVREGFYSNRTDFIRAAIRRQLDRHEEAVRKSVRRDKFEVGLSYYNAELLESVLAAGESLHIHVLGLATIAEDVTPELARAAIASIRVLGALQASSVVKAALSDRMT